MNMPKSHLMITGRNKKFGACRTVAAKISENGVDFQNFLGIRISLIQPAVTPKTASTPPTTSRAC